VAASTVAWLYLHQGGRLDATSGLYHFRHRDYSPILGRWTSLDPIRYEAGDVNLYRFVFNAPTVFTDPSGQIVWLPILLIGGAILITSTSIAVHSGLPERIGEANPKWAGSSNDYFARWAHRIEGRRFNDAVVFVTSWGSLRYRTPSFGQPGHTSSIWQYPVRHQSVAWRTGGMWVGRVFLGAFIFEGAWDGIVVIESAIETAFD